MDISTRIVNMEGQSIENNKTKVEGEPRKRSSCGCIFSGIIGVFFLLFLIWILMGNYLIASDPPKKVDAIVVLSGSESDRIPEAARLYKEGYSDTVILTDTGLSKTPTPGTEESPIDPNGIKTVELAGMGVPISNIILPKDIVNSTAGEAEAVLDTMQRQGMESAMIVTDPYHTRRAKIIFDRIFKGSGIHLRTHPVEGHWFQPFIWWLHPQGWKYTALEYLKLFLQR
jgi:uncharacterized SAM-binding protein YcdF (DUF218 family)